MFTVEGALLLLFVTGDLTVCSISAVLYFFLAFLRGVCGFGSGVLYFVAATLALLHGALEPT